MFDQELTITLILWMSLIGSCTCNDQKLNPNEIAPNFTLSTLNGPLIYRGINNKETNVKGPMIFHAFSDYSGFLEALWNKNSSLLDLIDNSPDNTNYVFLNSEMEADQCARWMESRFDKILEQYFSIALKLQKCKNEDQVGDRRSFAGSNERAHKRHQYFPKPHRRITKRSLVESSNNNNNFEDNNVDLLKTLKHKTKIMKRQHTSSKKWNTKNYIKRKNIEHYHNAYGIFDKHSPNNSTIVKEFHDDDQVLKRSLVATMYEYMSADEPESSAATNDCTDDALQKRVSDIVSGGVNKFKNDWKSRLHFVNVSVQELGNFIPLVLSRWHCSGHGCGLDQVAVETEEAGEVLIVSKRLDGRYDWLSSPYSLKSTSPRQQVVSIGDGCVLTEKNYTNQVVLISNDGKCSYFDKLKNAQASNALCAIIYTNKGESLFDMVCQGKECEVEMKIPGTMIPHEEGIKMSDLIKRKNKVYVKFQHTPWWNFFLAIDEQGKLQEVGWLVYPSMIFLSYQAKWLNYMTNLLHNITSMEDVFVMSVFNKKAMQGKRGAFATKTIERDVKKDLPRYQHVYLDMALGCPGLTDYSCPHWDHTVQLYLNCDAEKGKKMGLEIGRWVTPFRRRIGRWLTDIQPLVPLFSSQKCNFTMKTVPWAMTWKPSLTLRFTNKKKGTIDAPSEVIELFRGGDFDKTYNQDKPDRKRKKSIAISKDVTRVKLFATITGHGSDNNNCAEFCVTSHYFKINDIDNERIFDNAGTATGCADRVSEGSEPNEHGTWLYGRNGWCDGENVGPWIEDVTDQIKIGKQNNIEYKGLFNNKDPEPTRDAGNIIMYSYLVLYRKLTED